MDDNTIYADAIALRKQYRDAYEHAYNYSRWPLRASVTLEGIVA